MFSLEYTPLRRSMPCAAWWSRWLVAVVVALLLLLPVAVEQGWVRRLTGLPKGYGVHGESDVEFHEMLLDPGRARFGIVVLAGALMFAALVRTRRAGILAPAVAGWVLAAAWLRVTLWQPLGLTRHEISHASYAALALLDLGLVGVGAALLAIQCRSWLLAAGVMLSFIVVLEIGYLSRFGRGGAWLISSFEIPLTITSSLYQDVNGIAQALWQPLVALALVGWGVMRRRAMLERNPGPLCPHCEYPLPPDGPCVCAECGWRRGVRSNDANDVAPAIAGQPTSFKIARS